MTTHSESAMTIEPARLGGRLAAIRQLQNRSVSAVAAEAGVAKSYLAKLEKGEVENPGLRTITAIGKVLGVTLPDILERTPAGRDTRRSVTGRGELVDAHEFESLVAKMPVSLREFIREEEERGSKALPADVVRALAGVQLRGRRPESVEDWRFLYNAMLRSIGR